MKDPLNFNSQLLVSYEKSVEFPFKDILLNS